METKQIKMINGVNITQLGETVEAIGKQPELAKFTFKCKNEWMDGGHNQSTIQDFYGAGEMHDGGREFKLDCGEPAVLLGNDEGANPVEYVLNALVGCMTTTMVYHAAAQGIKINSIESKIEGNLDLHGFLQLKDDTRKGFQNIQVSFKVESDATEEQLESLAKNSPVYDIVSHPVPVTVQVNKG